MEKNILPKFAVMVEKQGIPLIHAIKNMVFHLISSLKIIIMSRIMKVRSRSGVSTKWFYS